MIRVLHTSDWHLGTALKGVSRDPDHARFLDWLAVTLGDLAIDVLVISGDVFDHAHPSAEALRLYYRFLHQVARQRVRHVVVVGGNHDSGARLDAPRDLLGDLDVHVVGGLDGDRAQWTARCVVPIRDAEGRVELVVLAVPYVPEFRLGVRTIGEDKTATARAFTELYASLVDAARALSATAPILALGHLAVAGTSVDDAPLQVHVFGREALAHTIFDARIDYVALGHIHRMGRQGDRHVWYPGSPIALTKAEADAPRHVLVVELDTPVRVTPVQVPTFRAMVKVEGSLPQVILKLQSLTWGEGELPPFAFVTVTDGSELQQAQREVMRVVPVGAKAIEIAFARPMTETGGTPAPAPPTVRLGDLDPEQVFRRLFAVRKPTETLSEDLLAAFREVLAPPDDDGAR